MTATVIESVKRESINLVKWFIRINMEFSDYLAKRFPNTFGNIEQRYLDFENEIMSHPLREENVLEMGGVDRPLLEPTQCKCFVGIDVDDQDRKAYGKYDRFHKQSVEEPCEEVDFDLIYSKTLIEHVPDNEKTFMNVWWSLAPGGETVHYFPSKNALYALFIRLVGNDIQRKVIKFLWGQDSLSTIGYPAYFDYCVKSEMQGLLETIGFKDIEIKCYYRANSYFAPFVPAFVLVSLYENFCRFFNLEALATGLLVTARKES